MSDIQTILQSLQDKDPEIQQQAINKLQVELKSMKQDEIDEKLLDQMIKLTKKSVLSGDQLKHFYDLISVANVNIERKSTLYFRLKGNITPLEDWGLYYVRRLINDINDVIHRHIEYEEYETILPFIYDFLFAHNSEIEAIDLMLETNTIKSLPDRVDEGNRGRVLAYLEELHVFTDVYDQILEIVKNSPSRTLVWLLKGGRYEEAVKYVENTENPDVKRQLTYMLTQAGIGNKNDLFAVYSKVAAKFDIEEPRKIHTLLKSLSRDRVQAAAIANGLANYGFGTDPVLETTNNEQIEQAKKAGHIGVYASYGLIHAYSPDNILGNFGDAIFANPQAGPVLAYCLTECDEQVALDAIQALSQGDKNDKIVGLICLAIVFGMKNNKSASDIADFIFNTSDADTQGLAVFVIGYIMAGVGHCDTLSNIIHWYSQKPTSSTNSMAILGISLFFYKNKCNIEDLERDCYLLALAMQNAHSGSPEVIEEILSNAYTGRTRPITEIVAIFGACIIGFGTDLSSYCVERILNSSQQLEPHLRSIYPLCLALMNSSAPNSEVIESLRRSLHAGDFNVASLVALGIVGAGTCSSTITDILESGNYHKDIGCSVALNFALGLTNLGKGLMGCKTMAFDKTLVLPKSFVTVLSLVFLFVGSFNVVQDHPYILCLVKNAMTPTFVATENGEELSVDVGHPVDTVGLAGNPSKITARVSHSLPIVLRHDERAESSVQVLTEYIEGLLVLKK